MNAKDALNPRWPIEPRQRPTCGVNVRYKTLPPGFPMERVVAGPTSVKHLYSGPNNYPVQTQTRPVNSLYGADFSQYNSNGAQVTQHFMAYPFAHRYVREVVTQAPVKQYEGVQDWPTRRW